MYCFCVIWVTKNPPVGRVERTQTVCARYSIRSTSARAVVIFMSELEVCTRESHYVKV